MDKARFIAEVERRLACDQRRADAVTFAVFQELRERITPEEAMHVASQLPHELKEMLLQNERPGRPVHRIHHDEFVALVRKLAALPDDAEAERSVKAVFATLQEAMGSPTGTKGKAWDVFSQLPKDLKTLWLSAHEA